MTALAWVAQSCDTYLLLARKATCPDFALASVAKLLMLLLVTKHSDVFAITSLALICTAISARV